MKTRCPECKESLGHTENCSRQLDHMRASVAPPSTAEVLKWIQTEIGAGMVLFPKTPEERAHNNACDRANAIIQNYKDGFGLFQMTRRLKTDTGKDSTK